MPSNDKTEKNGNGNGKILGKDFERVAAELMEDERRISDAFSGQDMLLDVKGHKTVHWSVSWADLMMTMFILFAVMYMYQSAHRELTVGAGKKNVADAGPGDTMDTGSGSTDPLKGARAGTIYDIYDLSKKAFKNQFLEEGVSVDLVADEAVKVILTGDVIFSVGKADLTFRAKKTLMDIAEIIRDTPYVINVVGHTDDVPNHSEMFPSNWELSAYRACAVVRFLVNEAKLPESRFFISAHSYLQPLKPNTSYKNRKENRRVELILTRERPYGVTRTPSDQIRDAYSREL